MYTSEPTNTMSPFTFFHTYISTSSIPINIPKNKNMPHFLPNLQLPITTSINLPRKLPAIFTSSWAAWSWIMIRCGPIKVAGSIDPLLRRRCSLTEAPPMANSWSPTRSPCSSAHVPFFFFWGKDSQGIFGKKNNMFKKLQQFSSCSTANVAIQTHIVERTFWRCHILKTCEQLKNLVLSHLTILLPSRPHKGFHKNKRSC